MQEFQQRVVTERDELISKIGKLQSFVLTPSFDGLPYFDQHLLSAQLQHMRS